MEKFTYTSKLYKIRLAKTERDIFGNPIPSDKWDVLVKAMDDDLRKKKEFKFIQQRCADFGQATSTEVSGWF